MNTIGHNITNFRSGIAQEINTLSERWAKNTIALGGKFKQARDSFPIEGNPSRAHRPGWGEWVKKETGWTAKHVVSFIQIHEKFEAVGVGYDTNLSYRVMLFLSGDSTPEAGVIEIMERAKGGERIGLDKAKDIAKQHRPSPAQARLKARAEGKLILASDGNLYSGATKDEAAAYSERRHQTFAVVDAITMLAEFELTPTQWLSRAEPVWLSKTKPADIKRAIAWLTKLEAKYGHD